MVNGQRNASLEIMVKGLRNQDGRLNISLFNKSEGFPEKIDNAICLNAITTSEFGGSFYFRNLSPGTYAFAILHDENMDGEMNKNFIGIPNEGFAFSDNYKPKTRAPKFSDAQITVHSGENHTEVKLIYIL